MQGDWLRIAFWWQCSCLVMMQRYHRYDHIDICSNRSLYASFQGLVLTRLFKIVLSSKGDGRVTRALMMILGTDTSLLSHRRLQQKLIKPTHMQISDDSAPFLIDTQIFTAACLCSNRSRQPRGMPSDSGRSRQTPHPSSFQHHLLFCFLFLFLVHVSHPIFSILFLAWRSTRVAKYGASGRFLESLFLDIDALNCCSVSSCVICLGSTLQKERLVSR